MVGAAQKLFALPLARWERDGLAAALHKAGQPVDDINDPHPLFWRFHTVDEVPVGFGGLELHGPDAVLRSLVTLPPLRRRGIGRAMVAALEVEAAALKATAVWLATTDCALFFGRLGYTACEAEDVPAPVRMSGPFASVTGPAATSMMKRL
jgi:N-acetylglutamate synthase-like GNAT family acetyltransferase